MQQVSQSESVPNFPSVVVLPTDFFLRTEISTRISYIMQFINTCDDAELLTWVRNQLSHPHSRIMHKLDKMKEEDEKSEKPLAKVA